MTNFPDKVRASDKVLALIADPNFMIEAFRVGWEDTCNPVEVWEAIAHCAKHKRPHPDWVTGYLADVAQRMTSADARAAPEMGKVLPGIMGFPRKPGPGRLLDPHGDKNDVMSLLLKFGIEIMHGCEPTEALHNAARNFPPDVFDRRDDRTLWSWLKQAVGLEHQPSTNAEWRAVLLHLFGSLVIMAELVPRYRGQPLLMRALFAKVVGGPAREQESRETLV